jgi:hypothetical protein
MTGMNREAFEANLTPIFHNDRQSRHRAPRLPNFSRAVVS